MYRKILITTVPGLEDITIGELTELLHGSRPSYSIISPGKLLLEFPNSSLKKIIKNVTHLRSVERAILVIFTSEMKGFDISSFEEVLINLPLDYVIKKFMTPYMSFAVSSKRSGKHTFTSIDVAKIVGEKLGQSITRVYKVRPKVILDNPDLTFYIDVIEQRIIFGIDITGKRPLHERDYKVFIHPTSLNPIIAYAMVKLAKIEDDHRVLDPMCGSATILIECGLSYSRVELYGIDINPDFIKGALINISRAGLLGRINLIVADATRLDKIFPPNFFDRVISNLPYGIKTHTIYPLHVLYDKFLKSLKKIVKKDSLIVLLTARGKILERAIRKHNYEVVDFRTIEQGGLYSRIYLIQP